MGMGRDGVFTILPGGSIERHMQQAIPSPTKGVFTDLLARYGLETTASGVFIHCLQFPSGPRPGLYLSVIPTRFRQLLNVVLPLLVRGGIPFSMAKDESTLYGLNNGFYGEDRIGKLLTIIPPDRSFIDQIKELAADFYGPEIINTYKISPALYADFAIPGASTKPISPESRDLGGRFLPVQLLKSDVKTDVFKALELSKWMMPRWCVVKRARKYRYYDEQDRDIMDIFRWQLKVYEDLKDEVPTPEIRAPFEEGGFAFLPMSYVAGVPFIDWVKQKTGLTPWAWQPLAVRQEILAVLTQVLGYIVVIHRKGYVHRDIHGSNFLVGKDGHVTLIDLEMLYHIENQVPYPAFGFGTLGYISPQQFSRQLPDQADDVYAIGALLVHIFTGIDPRRVPGHGIAFFCGSSELASVINACLSESREDRPEFHDVLEAVSRLGEAGHSSSFDVSTLLGSAIEGCCSDVLALDGPWYSLNKGVSGVIGVLAVASQTGVDIQPVAETVNSWLEALNKEIFLKGWPVPPGLFEGSAGIALMLSACLEANLLEDGPEIRQVIRGGIFREAGASDLVHGKAGQGVACLRSMTFLDFKEASEFLRGICRDIISHKPSPGEVYFLLCYGKAFNDPAALSAATKGLNGSGHGFGIALVYLEAYEISHDVNYRASVEKLLGGYSRYTIMEDLSLETGLSGLGYAYLEAYRVLGDKQWLDRADFTAQVLYNLKIHSYWLTNNPDNPSIGLMNGNAGVLYFLIQFNAVKNAKGSAQLHLQG